MKKRRIKAGVWRGKSQLHKEEKRVPKKREKAKQRKLPRRKHEWMKGPKSFPEGSVESWFHSKSAQI